MHRWFLAGALPVLALAAAPAGPDETQALLAQIKRVGREGAGNPQAARAWKALVAQGAPALPAILAAMSDNEPTAANWLRPAFDAIAERALRDGKPLPKKELEAFLAKTANPRAARRLAYEWLAKADKTAPDRWLPKMLHDPSPELRRDAVARVTARAEALLAKKEDEAARKTFREALAGATDQDQVDAISQALQKLGEKVDLQAHFGVVRSWRLGGPFDHHKGVGWDAAYPPEKKVDLAATYKGKNDKDVKWSAFQTKNPYGVVDLNKALGKSMGAVAYAYAVVDSPKEQLVELRAGSPNGLKIFLNGKPVFAREEYHHGASLDQYAPRGTLHKGPNEILLKVCQNEQTENWAQDWTFQLRLCDVSGTAVPFTEKQEQK